MVKPSPRNPRIDAYIEKAAPFARPILEHLRELVHRGCPEVVETIKWSAPHFEHHGMLCGMAAFKAHAAFGFWNAALPAPAGLKSGEAMGQFGKLTSLKDLPPDKVIVELVREAARLNEAGIKKAPGERRPRAPLPIPKELAAALRLKKNAKAKANYDALAPSHRREYHEWIGEAKTEPTLAKRLATTLEWLAEGKSRNWKYQAKMAAKK